MGVIAGFLFGAFCGMSLMCLVQVNRTNENINLRVKLEKLIEKWKEMKAISMERYKTSDYKTEHDRVLDENVSIIASLVSEELENIL